MVDGGLCRCFCPPPPPERRGSGEPKAAEGSSWFGLAPAPSTLQHQPNERQRKSRSSTAVRTVPWAESYDDTLRKRGFLAYSLPSPSGPTSSFQLRGPPLREEYVFVVGSASGVGNSTGAGAGAHDVLPCKLQLYANGIRWVTVSGFGAERGGGDGIWSGSSGESGSERATDGATLTQASIYDVPARVLPHGNNPGSAAPTPAATPSGTSNIGGLNSPSKNASSSTRARSNRFTAALQKALASEKHEGGARVQVHTAPLTPFTIVRCCKFSSATAGARTSLTSSSSGTGTGAADILDELDFQDSFGRKGGESDSDGASNAAFSERLNSQRPERMKVFKIENHASGGQGQGQGSQVHYFAVPMHGFLREILTRDPSAPVSDTDPHLIESEHELRMRQLRWTPPPPRRSRTRTEQAPTTALTGPPAPGAARSTSAGAKGSSSS